MPRTTVNIDGPILKDLKRLQKKKHKPLGRLISDLLARALGHLHEEKSGQEFQWTARPLHARVDLMDKEAVRAALERDA